MFSLNPQSGIPIYKQLMEQIRRMVSSGQLQPGTMLPSVRELAVTHAVNPMTISKAYTLLEAEGLLDRQRGKGMSVSSKIPAQESKGARLQRLQASLEQVVIAAGQLELNTEDVIKALRRKLENKS